MRIFLEKIQNFRSVVTFEPRSSSYGERQTSKSPDFMLTQYRDFSFLWHMSHVTLKYSSNPKIQTYSRVMRHIVTRCWVTKEALWQSSSCKDRTAVVKITSPKVPMEMRRLTLIVKFNPRYPISRPNLKVLIEFQIWKSMKTYACWWVFGD